MEIYLLRHAIAVDRGAHSMRDEDRPLTADGVKRMRLGALGMRHMGLRFDPILFSPILRARQTAEIVAEVLKADDALEADEILGYRFSCEAACDVISRIDPAKRPLLVGHEPDLGELAGYLTGGNSIPLKKASLCAIEVQPPVGPRSGTLLWLLEPKHLRALGEAD